MRRISIFATSIALAALVTGFAGGTRCRAADNDHKGDQKDSSKTNFKQIKPEEAKDYENQDVIVEFDVVSSRELGSGMCFLNSVSDFSDPTGFTAVITPTGLKKFKENPDTDKPAKYFKLKRVQVSGKVITYQKDKDSPKKYEIKIDDPAQVKIIEEAIPEMDKKAP